MREKRERGPKDPSSLREGTQGPQSTKGRGPEDPLGRHTPGKSIGVAFCRAVLCSWRGMRPLKSGVYAAYAGCT